MIVYREAGAQVETRHEIARVRRAAAAGGAADVLVGLGELEQGLVDALHPSTDGWGEVDALLRRAALEAGRAFLSAGAGRSPAEPLDRVLAEIDALSRHPLPGDLWIRPPEGYAHYALEPAGYALAAGSYLRDAGPRRAGRAGVIAVRSIGTSLSAVVAARLDTDRSVTIRPRGRTGERRVIADPMLEARVAAWAAEGADLLVVDEGPGATGETLEAVAAWLRRLGAVDRRIVLFPSRGWGMPIAPEARRRWFHAARKYPPPAGDDRPARIAARLCIERPADLSAGRWRAVVPGGACLPAVVIHERAKRLALAPGGGRLLLRFAGLGRWGEAAARRAALLADAGVGPDVVALEDGFLVRGWIEGAPVGPADLRRRDFLMALDAYLRARAPIFRSGHAAGTTPMVEMLIENACEALGAGHPGIAAAVRRLEALPPREAVIADGRFLPHEWIRSARGYHKVDAIDHGAGLRLPGPVDAAWDLAGAAVELALEDGVVAALVPRLAAAARDDPRAMADAMTAHRAPYAAFRLGEATLAAREATTPVDRARHEADARRYRACLARELARGAHSGRPRAA